MLNFFPLRSTRLIANPFRVSRQEKQAITCTLATRAITPKKNKCEGNPWIK